MKPKKVIKLICLILLYSSSLILCMKLQVDDDDKKEKKVPIINVHMEEPDRDPIEVKRIEEERRIERERIRDLEQMEEMDKRNFQQIISLQNNQVSKLSKIAETTTKLLDKLMKINDRVQNIQPRFIESQNENKNSPKLRYTQSLNNHRNGPIF